MKKIYSIFTLAIILTLFLCFQVFAAQTYGVIYDETDSLGSQTLIMQGEQTLYANLSEERGNSQELTEFIHNAVQPYMVERAWNGEDMTVSAIALTQAVDAMTESASNYILANCPVDSIGVEESEVSQQNSVDMKYIFDISDILSYNEWKELESRAESLSKRHDCGIYFAVMDDYRKYGNGSVFNATSQFYQDFELGIGDDKNGIIILFSTNERSYAMFVYGNYAEYAFNEYGQKKLEENFLEDFGANDWYNGISNYLNACDEYLTKAENGKPVHRSYWMWLTITVLLSCIMSGIICMLLKHNMKTVYQKVEANEYITSGGLCLTNRYDRYTHTTETRTKIEKERSGNSSGTTKNSGGGGSGRSGKF